MQIPSADPTGYCRLCFNQQQLRWLLQSADNPMVAQIEISLGVALAPEVDFPCTVCRLCAAALESFEALRERAKLCDEVLRCGRMGQHEGSAAECINFEVVECKQERVTPEPELLSVEQVLSSSGGAQEEPSGNADHLGSSGDTNVAGGRTGNNTILVGDIKVELLNVRPEGNSGQLRKEPKRTLECRVCKQGFVNETNLQRHIHAKHSSNQDPEALAAAVAAKRLRQPQSRPGEFKPISPKEIRKQQNMYTNSDGSPNSPHYRCNVCQAQFRQWQPFQRHRKIHGTVERSPGQAASNLHNVTPS